MRKLLLSILKAIFPPRSHTLVVHEIEPEPADPGIVVANLERQWAEYQRMIDRNRDRLKGDRDE